MGKIDGQKVAVTAHVDDISVVMAPPAEGSLVTVHDEHAVKMAAEAAEAEAAAAKSVVKLYTPTKGLPYYDSEQGVTFRPGERIPAKMTSWLDAQIKAGYIAEFAAE